MSSKIYKYIVILFFLFPFIAKAQFTFNRGDTKQENYYSIIPYTLENNKIIVPVKIQGKERRFLLDTGAPLLVSKALADELQMQTDTIVHVTDQSGKVKEMKHTTVNQVEFGGVVFDSIPSLIDENPILYECLNVDGFLGSNLLRNLIVQFSSDNKIVITDDKSKLKLSAKDSIGLFLTPNQSNPYIWIKLNGKKQVREQVLFDTGMNGFYDITLENYRYHKTIRKATHRIAKSWGASSYGIHGSADDDLTYLLEVPLLQIGKCSFENVKTQTTTGEHSRIGVDLLKYGTVTLDYLNEKFYFTPFEKEVDLLEKQLPISPNYKDNKFVVGIIWDKKLKKKINVGDQIIAINDTSYENVDMCDVIDVLSSGKKEGILSIRRKDGSVVKIEIKAEL